MCTHTYIHTAIHTYIHTAMQPYIPVCSACLSVLPGVGITFRSISSAPIVPQHIPPVCHAARHALSITYMEASSEHDMVISVTGNCSWCHLELFHAMYGNRCCT